MLVTFNIFNKGLLHHQIQLKHEKRRLSLAISLISGKVYKHIQIIFSPRITDIIIYINKKISKVMQVYLYSINLVISP